MRMTAVMAALAGLMLASPALADNASFVPAFKSPYRRLQAVNGYASELVIRYSRAMRQGLSAGQAKERALSESTKSRREVALYGEGYAAAVDGTFEEVVNSATVTPR